MKRGVALEVEQPLVKKIMNDFNIGKKKNNRLAGWAILSGCQNCDHPTARWSFKRRKKVIRGEFSSRKIYIGTKELLPSESQKIRNHSPDGFSWGYGGSGPAQLALAILLAFNLSKQTAQTLYQSFKWDVIAKLPQGDFELEDKKVRDWISEHKVEI